MLELGPQEEQYHLQIGEGLKSGDKIDLLFTFGKLGEHIAKVATNCFRENKEYLPLQIKITYSRIKATCK